MGLIVYRHEACWNFSVKFLKMNFKEPNLNDLNCSGKKAAYIYIYIYIYIYLMSQSRDFFWQKLPCVISSTLKMEVTRSSETSVYNEPTRAPEGDILHSHHRETLKSYNYRIVADRHFAVLYSIRWVFSFYCGLINQCLLTTPNSADSPVSMFTSIPCTV
jgi:hypothetical protein